MPDPAINPHDEAEALLPWYATGQLEGDERALVERHLASCLACQRQLRFDHRMIGEFDHLDPQVESGWARLRARLDKKSEPRHHRRALAGAWDFVRRPAVAMLVAAQLAFVVVAGGVLLSLDRPQYQALGSPAPAAARAANVIVVFHADATQRDIVGILRASNASLVGGPTAADAYLLRVPAERRGAALARLRADDDVQMAEPLDEAAP
jgi:anti-sigma factor RsiW